MPWREDTKPDDGMGYDLPNRQISRWGSYEQRIALKILQWVLSPIVSWVVWWYFGHWYFNADGLWFATMATILTTVVIYLLLWLKSENIRWYEIGYRKEK